MNTPTRRRSGEHFPRSGFVAGLSDKEAKLFQRLMVEDPEVDDEPSLLEAVMKAFVTPLNKAAKKSSLVTAECDDAVTAFRSLLARTAIPEKRADEWWERWEDF